jgi:adenylate cyclase
VADRVDEWIEAGIYDPTAEHAADRLALLRYSSSHGVALDELVRRSADGTLARAVVDEVLRVERTITVDEAARRVDLAPELLVRVWLALGFPPPPDGEPTLNEDDLGLLEAFHVLLDLFEMDAALQFTRVLGSSIARIGEAAVSSFLVNVEGRLLTDGAGEAERAKASTASAELAQGLPDLFRGLYRRHVELSVERSRVTQDHKAFGTFHLTVGFCDLVGYTAWSRSLAASDLARAVNTFEQAAHELITTAGGRLVKSLGDAVLFTTTTPEVAAAIALDLTAFVVADPVLTELRSALATGEVVGRDGDYYGPVVNLAARMVKETAPGTVVSDQPVPGFESTRIGAADLRGVGDPVELFVLSPPR